MRKYETKQGDKWDDISFTAYGDSKYANVLMEANTLFLNVFIFPAGISLMLPDLDTVQSAESKMPVWKKVAG